MSFRGMLGSRPVWFGAVFVAAMMFGGVGACRAQEVSPAIFTDHGVEDAYPAPKATPKKILKAQNATHAQPTASANRTLAQRRKVHHPARKRNVAVAPGL